MPCLGWKASIRQRSIAKTSFCKASSAMAQILCLPSQTSGMLASNVNLMGSVRSSQCIAYADLRRDMQDLYGRKSQQRRTSLWFLASITSWINGCWQRGMVSLSSHQVESCGTKFSTDIILSDTLTHLCAVASVLPLVWLGQYRRIGTRSNDELSFFLCICALGTWSDKLGDANVKHLNALGLAPPFVRNR